MRDRTSDPRLQRSPAVERTQVAPPSRDLVEHLRKVFLDETASSILNKAEAEPHQVLNIVANQAGREQVIEYLDSLIAQHGEVQ